MNTKMNRRGFTLAELSVVLAVLSIVSIMVASFTAMVSNSRQLSTARLEALQDVRVVEELVEGFIEGNEIKTSFSDDVVETTLASDERTIGLEEIEEKKTLVIKKGDDVETKIALERVTEITFDYYGDNADYIIYCTIHYQVGNNDYEYTFCVCAEKGGADEG